MDEAISVLTAWIKCLGSESVVLNVAGSRESKSPGLRFDVKSAMVKAID